MIEDDLALTGGQWRPLRGVQVWIPAPLPALAIETAPTLDPDDEWRELLANADPLTRERYGDQAWFPTPPPAERRWSVEPDDEITTARRRRALLDDYATARREASA